MCGSENDNNRTQIDKSIKEYYNFCTEIDTKTYGGLMK